MTTGKQILLVEPDPKLAYVLKTVLQDRGCNVLVCSDPQAVTQLDGEHFDVALLDVRLPVETGVAMAHQLMQKYTPLKIIFLTGYDDLKVLDQRVPGSTVLAKPFDLDSLWNLL